MSSARRLIHDSAAKMQALGARYRLRGCPSDVAGAFDFASAFRFGTLTIRPTQVRDEIVPFLNLVAENPPRTVVELGTGFGGTFLLLTRAAADNATLVTVELPQYGYPRSRTSLLRRFARADQSVHLIRADSHNEATLLRVKTLTPDGIDLLFIDGDHSYDGVGADYRMYSPLVRSGGLIAFHDIVDGLDYEVGGVPAFWPEVKRGASSSEFVADRDGGGYGIGVLTVP